jgi:hypothetical protein
MLPHIAAKQGTFAVRQRQVGVAGAFDLETVLAGNKPCLSAAEMAGGDGGEFFVEAFDTAECIVDCACKRS